MNMQNSDRDTGDCDASYILAYIYHANNKFYIILILGKLVRVLESSLPRQRIEVNSRVVKPWMKLHLDSSME